MDVSDLKGVGAKTAKKLREVGYDDITSLARTNAQKLHDRSGISEGKCDSIIARARIQLRGDKETSSFTTADEVAEQQKGVDTITTSSEEIDNLFHGGIPTRYVTETYGQYGSAKTQLGHQLAVNVQLPEDDGGLDAKAVYIDTEETFMASRIRQMAEAHDMDGDETLANIHVAQPRDSSDQLDVAKRTQKLCTEENIRLIVVDSVIAHFRTDFTGRGDLAERQQLLSEHLADLRELASAHNAAVYITNQVMSNPDKMFGNPIEPVGGNVLGHKSSFRVSLSQKSEKNQEWRADLKDSPNLPQRRVLFTVTDEGVRDV